MVDIFMTFREFLNLQSKGHMDLVKQPVRMPAKGNSFSRAFSAGKVKNPFRPARLSASNSVTMMPSNLN